MTEVVLSETEELRFVKYLISDYSFYIDIKRTYIQVKQIQ